MDTVQRIPPAPPELQRVSSLDLTALGLYITLFALAGQLLLPLLKPVSPNAAIATYSVNLISYGCVGIVAFLAARHIVARDLRILGTRPWFTLLMLPACLLGMLIVTSILVALAGTVEPSVNQASVQELIQQVPAWLIVPLLVVVAPFVEEYFFRHLLIGKLSRRINIWVCCGLSVVLFAALHVLGKQDLTLTVLLPYLAMGASLVFVYVWTGKNLMFSYFVHAAKNLLAVVFIYAIPAELMDQLQQLQP
ncbi:type II CAAX endopeptidase family protein [Arthrobacter sp.]|uniref:CPBP family intramembrane glutamic endopeptidase n=1 Tax=Arthrobacter sp. TaxID=1667 RepID=UPI00281126D7|nr:type II CAAX endopeptidase family protein [Arthrobacter sp.]